MTMLRKPTITPGLFAKTYSQEIVNSIIEATRLKVVESERDWLRRSLDAEAFFYAQRLQIDAEKARGQKSSAGWHEYISGLAVTFSRAFARKAAGTIGGPFDRFAYASMAHIGLTEVPLNSIRDTLRKKRPGRKKRLGGKS